MTMSHLLWRLTFNLEAQKCIPAALRNANVHVGIYMAAGSTPMSLSHEEHFWVFRLFVWAAMIGKRTQTMTITRGGSVGQGQHLK